MHKQPQQSSAEEGKPVCHEKNTRRGPGRPATLSAEEARRRRAETKAGYRRKHRAAIREAQNEKNFRWRHARSAEEQSLAERIERGLTTVIAAAMNRPPLRYIDADGTVRTEDYRSAEQLIKDFLQEKRGPS